jgi:hypothetical protein
MSESQATRNTRAPWHLWVIGGIALLWSAMGAMDYVVGRVLWRNVAGDR